MLVRSRLVDLKPFRTGLVVGAFGLMIALGRDEGGAIGGALGGGLAHVIGDTGALIVGVALFIAGTLLFTGASAGAVLRRSGTAMRNAGNAARRSLDTRDAPGRRGRRLVRRRARARRAARRSMPSTSYPDVIAPVASSAEAPPLVAQADEYTPDERHGGRRRGDRLRDGAGGRLPPARALAAQGLAAGRRRQRRRERQDRRAARADAVALRRRRHDRRPDRRPAGRALRAPARARGRRSRRSRA